MRVRAVVAIVCLLLPAEVSAQRLPLPGRARRGPARPAPLPPQPEPVARPLAYKRMRLSVEAYPLISYVQSPGFTGDGLISGWTTFGTGTRADYRLSRFVSATLDLTSSFVGGPALIETAEVGTRLRPERSERRAYPFVDVRVGYTYAYNRHFGTIGDISGDPATPAANHARYSQGFGAVAGAGLEYTLTRTLSLTTAASLMRTRMTSHDFMRPQTPSPSFAMTSLRYTVGIRYNRVRVIRPPGSDLR